VLYSSTFHDQGSSCFNAFGGGKDTSSSDFRVNWIDSLHLGSRVGPSSTLKIGVPELNGLNIFQRDAGLLVGAAPGQFLAGTGQGLPGNIGCETGGVVNICPEMLPSPGSPANTKIQLANPLSSSDVLASVIV